ncbi:MAG: hypothetical protein ACK4TA_25535 [Saprospiraceae bacterium]
MQPLELSSAFLIDFFDLTSGFVVMATANTQAAGDPAEPTNHSATPANHLAAPADHLTEPANHSAEPTNHPTAPANHPTARRKLFSGFNMNTCHASSEVSGGAF